MRIYYACIVFNNYSIKKILLVLTLIFGFTVIQAQEKSTSKHRFDLLKEKSTTKILYDRVAHVAKLTESKEEAFNSTYYKQAFYEIQRSDYLERLPALEILENETKQGFVSKLIPISILVSEFDVLKSEVRTNGMLQYNSNEQYEPTSSTFDYFETHKIGLASPLIKQLKGTKIDFVLKNDLIFNTTSSQISKIEANFDNKGFIKLNENQKITINFSSLGEKTAEFKITLQNGEVYTNRVAFKLTPKAQPLDYSQNISQRAPGEVTTLTSITSSLTYQGYDEIGAHAGQGEFQIFYDNEAGLLDKIILVCDGFDPADGRDVNSIYSLLNYGDPVENLGDNVRDLGYDELY